MSCYTLPRCHSDHFPLLFTQHKGERSNPAIFKYFAMWAELPDCERLATEVWFVHVSGCPMRVVKQNLKNLKAKFKSWNKHVFGDIKQGVNQVLEELEHVQSQIASFGFSDKLHQKELFAQSALQKALAYE